MKLFSIDNLYRGAAAAALGIAACAAPLATMASPTDSTVSGNTLVALSSTFLNGLTGLGVQAGEVLPGILYQNGDAVDARFPITTGAIDLGATTAEIDHAGGISLTAGSGSSATRVALTAFAIDVNSTKPKLTGLVTVDGNFVGRITLFDLSLGEAKIAVKDNVLTISNVGVKLNPKAAMTLSSIFKATVPALQVGTARVRTVLGPN